MSGSSEMLYQNINRIYADLTKIVVKKYQAAIGGLSRPWSDLNSFKSKDMHKISDSIQFADFKLFDDTVEESETSSWKIHLSIHPQDLGKAWDIIFPILISNKVIEFKVTRLSVAQALLQALKKVDAEYLAKRNLSEQDKQQGIEDIVRVYHGMQVTIYIPQGKEKKYNELLSKIESKLQAQNIRPGIVDKSDRILGYYSSVRNAGKSYTTHDKVTGYKARTDIDPFIQVKPKHKLEKLHLIGMDYYLHTEKAKNMLQQVVDAKQKYGMAIIDKGELEQVYDVAQEYFTFWQNALNGNPEQSLKGKGLERFKEFKRWIDHGHQFIPSFRGNIERKVKEAEDLLQKASAIQQEQNYVRPQLVRQRAFRGLDRDLIKPKVPLSAPSAKPKEESEQLKESNSAKVLSELSLHRRKSVKKLSSKSFSPRNLARTETHTNQESPVSKPVQQIVAAPAAPVENKLAVTNNNTSSHIQNSFAGAGVGILAGAAFSIFFLPAFWAITVISSVALLGACAGYGFSKLYFSYSNGMETVIAQNSIPELTESRSLNSGRQVSAAHSLPFSRNSAATEHYTTLFQTEEKSAEEEEKTPLIVPFK